jgi:hypothetical protein
MHRITHANGVVTYTFAAFAGLPLQAHVSTRHGGVSPAPWNTLNFGVTRGDTPQRVAANRERLAEALGIAAADLVRCKQVHGAGVAKVSADDAGALIEASDALITDTPGLPLFLTFADCTPLVFYDPRHHALGICHAGWRGTVNGAAIATLWAMQAAYDTNPAAVRVGIGPSIGPQSYEVGSEVQLLAYAKLPNAEHFFRYPNGAENNPYFDLWQANASQLIAAGVPPAQIEISAIDTAQNTADFFSHRAEQGRCGLFALTAWLDVI